MKPIFLFRKVTLIVYLICTWTLMAGQGGAALPFRYDNSVFCSSSGIISPQNPCNCTYRVNSPDVYVNNVTGEINLENIYPDSSDFQLNFWVYRDYGSPVQTDSFELMALKAPPALLRYPFTAYCETYDRLVVPQSPSSEVLQPNRNFWPSDTTLKIDPQTGNININKSKPGRYEVYYEELIELEYWDGSDSANFSCLVGDVSYFDLVEIDNQTKIEFRVDSVCKGVDTILKPTVLGDRAGTWKFPSGTNYTLGIPPTISPATMDSGQYVIEYLFNDVCRQSVVDTIWILTDIYLGEVYPEEFYCQEVGTAYADAFLPKGKFSSSTLNTSSLNASTGTIDFHDLSFPSQHIVEFTTLETCPRTASTELDFRTANTEIEKPNPEGYCIGNEIKLRITPDKNATSTRVILGDLNLDWDDPNPRDFKGTIESDNSTLQVRSSANGCNSSQEQHLTIKSNPGPDTSKFPSSSIVTPNRPLEVPIHPKDSTIPGSYSWQLNFSNSVDISSSQGEGQYYPGQLPEILSVPFINKKVPAPIWGQLVIGFSQNRCPVVADTLNIEFIFGWENGFFIPEVITPNGDGANDSWIIEYDQDRIKNPADYVIKLFDLHNVPLAEISLPQAEYWNWENLPAGVYWWQLTGPNQEPIDTGGLTIVLPPSANN